MGDGRVVLEGGWGEDGLFYRIESTDTAGRLLVSLVRSVGGAGERLYGKKLATGVGWFRYSLGAAKIKGEYELKLLRAIGSGRYLSADSGEVELLGSTGVKEF